MYSNSPSGFAIALAWPQTYCKQAGAWYDGLMRLLGFNRRHYYRAGHAAVVLVEAKTGSCHYFDFGRYHAPFQQGRVRSAATDPELGMKARARFQGKKIENLREILTELSGREACHGSGSLYASVCEIDFPASFAKALHMQQRSPIPYGPFVKGGTNCSRFVHKVLLAGKPSLWHRVLLRLPYTLTPSPISNVWALGIRHKIAIDTSIRRPICKKVVRVLPPPPRPLSVPKESRWLSGEGAGSWFLIQKERNNYTILRYDEQGKQEYVGLYQLAGNEHFAPDRPFDLLYLTHFQQVNVLQNQQHIRMTLVQDHERILNLPTTIG